MKAKLSKKLTKEVTESHKLCKVPWKKCPRSVFIESLVKAKIEDGNHLAALLSTLKASSC